jgi:hypothetical protein
LRQRRAKQFVAEKFRYAVKRFRFTFLKPLRAVRISRLKILEGEVTAMKNAVPLFLALIPLIAVVGAYVAVP